MSRVATPSMTPSATTPTKLPYDKVAMRAYEKWCHRGCPHGTDVQDWLEAETEIRTEMIRTTSTSNRR
jgi:hypothetical protein